MESRTIVDTSVWIEFFKNTDLPEVEALKRGIIDGAPLILCPIIIQEVLQGIRFDKDFRKVKSSLLAFPIINWEPVDAAIAAAELYRRLRKNGVTIRKSNDCLIAAFARKEDAGILHIDRDFSLMAENGFIREVK